MQSELMLSTSLQHQVSTFPLFHEPPTHVTFAPMDFLRTPDHIQFLLVAACMSMRQVPHSVQYQNDVQGSAKKRAPGSVNVRRKIAFFCLLQAEERNFSPHIHGSWGPFFNRAL